MVTDSNVLVMIQPQNMATTFEHQANSRKRSSTDVGEVDEKPSSFGKRMRADHTSQPQFEHHASFNSSFGSAPDKRPSSTDDVHDLHDDSGIGLSLLDEPFSLSSSAKEHTSRPKTLSHGLDVLHASLS
jgi:hypothetical protein